MNNKWLQYKIIFPFLARLPYAVSYQAAKAYWMRDASQQQSIRLAFEHALPQVSSFLPSNTLNPDQLANEYLEMMAHEMMDIFHLAHEDGKNSQSLVTLEGLEHLSHARKQGNGVILIMGHYGRPTMLSSRVGLANEHHGIVTQNINDGNPDRDPDDVAYLQFKVATTLHFAKGPWIAQGHNTKDIYKALAENKTLIILLDVYEPNEKKTKQFDFLGGKLRIPVGIERLAQRTGSRMVYGVAHCEGKNVNAQLRPLPEDPSAGLCQAVYELEQDVIKSPSQWWQWNTLEHLWQPNYSSDLCTHNKC